MMEILKIVTKMAGTDAGTLSIFRYCGLAYLSTNRRTLWRADGILSEFQSRNPNTLVIA